MLDIAWLQDLAAQYPVFDNPYIQSLIVLLFFVLASKVFAVITNFILTKIVTKTKTDLDDKLIDVLKKPITHIIVLVGIYWAVFFLKLSENYTAIINNIIETIVYLVVTYALVHMIDILIDSWGKTWAKKTKSTIDDQILPLIHRFSKYVLLVIAFMLILDQWGVEIGPFLASLGIAGIAIGFAVKDSLANIFGGLSLIMDKTFKVGDRIKLESGEVGHITDIGLRSTRIKTFDNDMIIVPNGDLATKKIYTYSQPSLMRRVVVDFGVEYGNDSDRVKKLVFNELKKIEGIVEDPEPSCVFVEMAASALMFKAIIWIPDYKDSWSKKLEMTEKIYKLLNKNKIVIPFNTQTVYVKKD